MSFSDDNIRHNRFTHPAASLASGDANPPPTEVECSLDGHRLPSRHTFTSVGYPTLSGEVLEYSPEPLDDDHDPDLQAALAQMNHGPLRKGLYRTASGRVRDVYYFPEAGLSQFAVNGTLEVTEVHPGLAHLVALARNSFAPEVARRLEKAEWEEQLVTRQFPLPQVHWDFAEEALQRTPPHRLEEAMNLYDLVKDVSLPRLGGKPLTAGYLRSFPIAVSQPSAMGQSEAPAAKPRTETWTGLNGTLTLEDGTTIPVRDGTLTINHKD